MLKSSPEVPVSLTLFGNRVVDDTVNLQCDHSGSGWAVVQYVCCGERRRDTVRGAQGESRMKAEAEEQFTNGELKEEDFVKN